MKLYTSFPEFLSSVFHFPDVWSKAYDLTTLVPYFSHMESGDNISIVLTEFSWVLKS